MGNIRPPSQKQIEYGKRIHAESVKRRFRDGKWLCTVCGERKPESEYHNVNTRTGAPPSQCAVCSNAQSKSYQDRNKHKFRLDPKVKEANKKARLEKTLSQEMTCGRCGKTKSRSEWPIQRGTDVGGFSGRPRKYCCSPKKRTEAEVAEDIKLNSKVCTSCEERKPFEQFSPNKQAQDGRQTTCKKCRRAKIGSGQWRGGRTGRQKIIEARSDGSLTTKVVGAMFAEAKVCPCCTGEMDRDDKTMDHIVPLKLGGEHSVQNTMILCRSCNITKNAKHPSTWLALLNDDAAGRMKRIYKKKGFDFA